MTPETLAFGQVQRLTDRLKELVRKYPKGVGIFKEFLQNADDAGASSLTMILDCQTYSSTKLPLSEMAVLQGPSLVFINDKPFSAEDWKRIQSIGNSGKAHDIQKTGRFGLGFNSVYNVTDYPMLLTNGHLGVFDPHENVVPRTHSEPGAAWRIEELLQSESELLTPFQHYGLKDATNFDSTIFRLPLRTARLASASEISNEGFTKQDFEDIVAAIVDQGCGVLLFLNNVLNFYVGVIQKDGMRKSVLSVETLNPDFVEMQRAKIRSCVNGEIMNTLDYLKLFGSEEVYYEHEFKITRGLESVSESWSVVRGVYSSDDLIVGASEMSLVGEKAVPIAGAAVNLEKPVASGMLSCALPLPTKSGIPIHVDGFFDLQDSRQDLHQDETATGRTSQTRVGWNRTLLRDGCAIAASSLLVRIGEKLQTPAYTHWPRAVGAENRLVELLPNLIYQRLSGLDCISAGPSPQFVNPDVVFLSPPTLRPPLLADRLLIENPSIPVHVRAGFKNADAELKTLSPGGLRAHFRSEDWQDCRFEESPLASLRRKEWIVECLSFCLKDDRFDDFNGVSLALMSDGTLRDFDMFSQDPIFLGGEVERRLLADLSGTFIDETISELSIERLPGVVSMTLADLVERLPRLFDGTSEEGYLCAEADSHRKPTTTWLTDFYNYCVAANEREQIREMPGRDVLESMPLVPDSDGDLWGMGTESTPIYEISRRQLQWKKELFGHADRNFVSTSGELGIAIKEFCSSYSGWEIQAFSPQVLADCLARPEVRREFLADCSATIGSPL